MAETVGSLIDKIAILHLRVYHLEEQVSRPDATEAHARECRHKLGVLQIQKKDLLTELKNLLDNVTRGRQRLKVYRQFKLYNDPKFKIPMAHHVC